MSDERREVLRMFEKGTINAEEAEMLIRAISATVPNRTVRTGRKIANPRRSQTFFRR